MKKSSILLLVCLCGFAALNAISQSYVKHARGTINLKFESPHSRMPEELTMILAGEFQGLLADFLVLEIGSFAGSNQVGTDTDYENIYHTLKAALALDPYFKQAYFYGQAMLPWEAQRPDWANELLEIPRSSRPWDWRPGYYMAFNHYYFLDDYTRASELLIETSKIEKAPTILALLGSRFALKEKRSAAAVVMLEDMLNDDKLSETDHREIQWRIKQIKDIVTLEQAIARYFSQFNAYPPELTSLVEKQFIGKVPENPYGGPYLYDPANGQVTFDKAGKKD